MAEDKTKPKVKEVENTKPADEAAKDPKVEGTAKENESPKPSQEDKSNVESPKEEEISKESPVESSKPIVSSFEKALARRRGTRLQTTFNEVKAERQGVPNKGLSFEELKELRR